MMGGAGAVVIYLNSSAALAPALALAASEVAGWSRRSAKNNLGAELSA